MCVCVYVCVGVCISVCVYVSEREREEVIICIGHIGCEKESSADCDRRDRVW